MLRRLLDRIEQHRLDAYLVVAAHGDGAHAQGVADVQSKLAAFTPQLLQNPSDRARRRPGFARLVGERKRLQRDVSTCFIGRQTDAGAALERQTFEIIPAQIRQEGARRRRAIRIAGARFGPPAVGVVLHYRLVQGAMQQSDYLRAIKGELVGDLLRFEARFLREKLLDAVLGVHRLQYRANRSLTVAAQRKLAPDTIFYFFISADR